MANNQKNKGSGWEREVSSALTQIFDLPFTRTLSSGAFIGGKNQHRKAGLSQSMINSNLGDIVTPDEWNFIIECKFYKELNFNGLIQGFNNTVSGWLDEVLFDADYDENHCLIFKINRAGAYIVLPHNAYFVEKFIEVGLPYTMYPHYIGDELAWYCVIDWVYLTTSIEGQEEIQTLLKEYVVHLSEIVEDEKE